MNNPLPLDPIETASRDELMALQLERLKWSLAHAYENSPVYRRKFDEAGVHPDDVKTLADLARFPFTTKKDLRDNYPYGMFAVPHEQISAATRRLRTAAHPCRRQLTPPCSCRCGSRPREGHGASWDALLHSPLRGLWIAAEAPSLVMAT